jgi:hypothetical protein
MPAKLEKTFCHQVDIKGGGGDGDNLETNKLTSSPGPHLQ